jgi:hypothetical protein
MNSERVFPFDGGGSADQRLVGGLDADADPATTLGRGALAFGWCGAT